MTRVVLVTVNHPFEHNGGETMFVAPEVERLAGAGLEVRLAPLVARGCRQPLPGGVQLDLGLANSLQAGRWTDWLRAPGWPGFAAEWQRARRQGGFTGMLRVVRWAAVAQATWRWAQALPDAAPVLVYTYWRGGATLALARLAAQKPRIAALTRVHGYELYEERFDPPFQPWTGVYAQLASVCPVSAHGAAYLVEHGVPAARVQLARLGTEATAAAVAASADGVLRVLSCSFVLPLKRVTRLARALALLAARHPLRCIAWTHLGGGPDLSAVRELVRGAPANLVATLPGHVEHERVLAHYAHHPVDVFVLLSQTEGLPVSVQEALSAGVPVVATDVGGTGEAVDDQVGRLLGADPSVDDVVAAIEAVALAPDAQRQAMRAAARLRWAERFDADANHRAFARHLQALAAGL